MGRAAWLLALVAVPAQGGPEAGDLDRVLMADRTECRGEITAVDSTGCLEISDSGNGRKTVLIAEQVRRIRFGKDEPLPFDPKAERVRLVDGGSLSGRLLSFEGRVAALETPAGTFRIPREAIRSISLAPLLGRPPEVKEERKDILLREDAKAGGEGKPEVSAVAGELRSITAAGIAFQGAKEEVVERSSARTIYLFHDAPAGGEPPPGWFAKAVFRNGDRLTGVLRSAGKGRVGIFSRFVGDADVEKRHLLSISFSAQPRLAPDRILVCEQGGVREFDAQGREVWSYRRNVHVAGSARRIENGNVLIANTNYNQVIEVEPEGKGGGRIVWQLDNVNYPCDAVRLENGNVLVAEQQANRVTEFDAKTKSAVWTSASRHYPTSVQRLENGNTLVCSFRGIEEVDRSGTVRWSLGTGRIRPWKAQRLDNGNTLITDHQMNQVVEVDPRQNEVWKMEGLQRPFQAVRTEDGNTLILEQGAGRVIEVDPARRVTERITGLNMPQGLSAR